MAFVDEMTIHATAGKGGDGVVRWLHLKGKEFSGPAGGNGGRGGSVIIRGVRDIGRLAKYRHEKEFKAEHGAPGGNNSKHGKSGEDLTIDIPVGSIITNRATGKQYEILEENQEVEILKGGTGGLGNEHFKSSTNVKPEEFTPGKPGEEADIHIELKLIVDAGFIGFPNAGKSSLLNAITNADARVGNYQFTTLEPNLGALYEFILADIPGLIEGASDGKGLGHKFLRHVSRTRFLVHCISLENESILDSYTTIRKELENYSPELIDKPELLVLTKRDTIDSERVDAVMKEVKHLNIPYTFVSVLDDDLVKQFSIDLVKMLRGEAQ